MAGPYVFGDQRRHLWVQSNTNLTDKLKHFLPRLRAAIPNLTDIELPPDAAKSHAKQVREAGFFCHMYEVAHGRSPEAFADAALANHGRIGAGALELNFEGAAVEQMGLNAYITRTIARVRKAKPNLPVQANVVPHKSSFMPVQLFVKDSKLTVCVQGYGGNMEALESTDDQLRAMVRVGIPIDKVNLMHAVMCSQKVGGRREVTMPQVRNRGSFYIDDLLLDAGLLP